LEKPEAVWECWNITNEPVDLERVLKEWKDSNPNVEIRSIQMSKETGSIKVFFVRD